MPVSKLEDARMYFGYPKKIEELKTKYKQFALDKHPDKTKNENSQEWIELNVYYNLLKEELQTQSSTKSTTTSKKKVCKICHKEIANVIRHVREVHEKVLESFQCMLCEGNPVFAKYAFKYHNEKFHKTESWCEICNKSLSTAASLKNHKKKIHGKDSKNESNNPQSLIEYLVVNKGNLLPEVQENNLDLIKIVEDDEFDFSIPISIDTKEEDFQFSVPSDTLLTIQDFHEEFAKPNLPPLFPQLQFVTVPITAPKSIRTLGSTINEIVSNQDQDGEFETFTELDEKEVDAKIAIRKLHDNFMHTPFPYSREIQFTKPISTLEKLSQLLSKHKEFESANEEDEDKLEKHRIKVHEEMKIFKESLQINQEENTVSYTTTERLNKLVEKFNSKLKETDEEAFGILGVLDLDLEYESSEDEKIESSLLEKIYKNAPKESKKKKQKKEDS